MKIWSLPKHENLTTDKTFCGKEEKLLLRGNSSSFPQYFQYISNFKSPITYTFVQCGCSNYFFLNSATLICRGTNISKYFRESLGIRDNESRLYMFLTFRILFEPAHGKTYNKTFVTSEYSDQSAQCNQSLHWSQVPSTASRLFKEG